MWRRTVPLIKTYNVQFVGEYSEMQKKKQLEPETRPQLARAKRLSQIVGIPESTIWAMVHKNLLPKPIKFGKRHTLFDVEATIATIKANAK
jgi:predicted DNA-binding transcriptional regulator AlpA